MSGAPLLRSVIDGLVSAWGAALDVPVLDGPQAIPPSSKRYVLVGADSLNGSDGEIAESTTTRSTMGNGDFADETGEVTCSAWAWTGATAASEQRVAAFDLVDACEAALAADPTLGGVLALGHYIELRSQRLVQQQAQNGLYACVRFTLVYSALVTP